jgi:hypothetical protein
VFFVLEARVGVVITDNKVSIGSVRHNLVKTYAKAIHPCVRVFENGNVGLHGDLGKTVVARDVFLFLAEVFEPDES